MQRPTFGRKMPASGTPSQSQPPPPGGGGTQHPPGHEHVLAHIRKLESENPRARSSVAGGVIFDFVYRMVKNDRGVRIEDLLAVLASVGGFSCIVAALADFDGQSIALGSGITIAEGKDGYRYFFGDCPNRYLIESQYSLLSLALGAAQAAGGKVALAMVHDTMSHVAKSIGGSDFGKPGLPDAHMPGDLPINYVRVLWPKILEALDLYEVRPDQRPEAIGMALYKAIDVGKSAIDPALAAKIAIECAVPAAKIDPARVGFPVTSTFIFPAS